MMVNFLLEQQDIRSTFVLSACRIKIRAQNDYCKKITLSLTENMTVG